MKKPLPSPGILAGSRAVRLLLLVAIGLGAWWLSGQLAGGGSADVEPARIVQAQATGELDVGPSAGALAPDFEASDSDGNRFRLSDYRGWPVLVNFWATWCVACKAEMPAIQGVLEHHRTGGFTVIAVNEGEGAEAARQFLEDMGVDFHLALDPDRTVGDAYRLPGLPGSFFVDRDGVIREVWYGEMSVEMVEEFAHATFGPASVSTSDDLKAADLTVALEPEGPGSLYLISPAIRCTPDYCANHLLHAVQVVPAVTSARSVVDAGEVVAIFVRFEPSQGGPKEIVDAFRDAFRENPDPIYGELAVRYVRPEGADDAQ